MTDLEKLVELFEILTKALKGIEDVGELSDYHLDNAVEEVYRKIDDLSTDIYGIIYEMEYK